MLGMEEIKALLQEVKGMRHDLNANLGQLIAEVRKVNVNLEEIERQNKERFEQRHAALRAELAHEPRSSRSSRRR